MVTGGKRIGATIFGLLILFILISVDIAYGFGGGGHHGDGRTALLEPTTPADKTSGSGDTQNATPSSATNGPRGYSSSGVEFSFPDIGYHWTQGCGYDVVEGGIYGTPLQQPILVPEPAAILPLILGIIGLAGARRKLFAK